MDAMRSRVSLAVLAAGLALIAGCPSTDSTFTNQGGGNLLTAVGKVLGSNIDALTPDELQIMVSAVGEFDPQFAVEVTDEQAAAGIDFIKANNIRSIADIEALIAQAEQDPGSVVIPDSVLALIQAGDIQTG